MILFPDISKCVVRIASSELDREELVRKIIAMNDAEHTCVVQLFDSKIITGRLHILGAYANAVLAFEEKTNVSKNVATEMMLFAAMTMQISDAIKKVGIKSTKGFVVFANNEKSFALAKKLMKDTRDLKDKDSDIQILQRMAAARLGN